jgi:thiol-disulfide isomerase/thioredoxin
MKRLPARRFPLIVACSIAGAGCGPSAESPLPGVPATTAAPAAPTGPAAAAKAMQDGVEAWSAGKHDEAIADFAKAYELHPTNLQTAAVYGATLQLYAFEAKDPKVRNERLLRSAQVMRTLAPSLAQIGPVQRQKVLESIFNEGCVYADEGKPARAFDSLKEAIDLGYRDAKQLETDVTLAPLRKLPEFADLSKRIDAREAEEFQKSFAGFTSFPFQFSLSDVDGKPHTLAELKGKVAVVDFWGTWCLPCREELPTLAALSRKYKDQGLAMVGVNYELHA